MGYNVTDFAYPFGSTSGAVKHHRQPDSLPGTRATTGTNAYGNEVAVVDGVATWVAVSVGNMAVPAGGYALSGHGDSGTWLKTYAVVGARITLS